MIDNRSSGAPGSGGDDVSSDGPPRWWRRWWVRGGAVLLVLVAAGIVLWAAGGDDEQSAGTTTSPAPATGTTAATATTTPPTTTAPPTTSVPPAGRQPTPDEPLRVLFAGDSIGAELAAPSIAALRGGGSAVAYFVANTAIPRDAGRRGLWEQRLAQSDPEVVVVLIGAWERMVFGAERAAGLSVRQYRNQLIDPFVDLVTSQGAELIWVGAPPFREPQAREQVTFLNAIYRSVAEEDDRVTFVDGAAAVDGPGGYREVVTNPDGHTERVRRLDGTHLCPGGAVRLAAPVLRLLEDRWNVPLDAAWPNGAWRHDTPFEAAPAECPTVG